MPDVNMFVAVEAAFAKRNIGEQMDREIELLAASVKEELQSIAEEGLRRLRLYVPDAEWTAITAKDVLPIFLDRLNAEI